MKSSRRAIEQWCLGMIEEMTEVVSRKIFTDIKMLKIWKFEKT